MDFAELVRRSIRILHISRKPTAAEFSMTARVTGLGMILFGLIGFIISVIFNIIR